MPEPKPGWFCSTHSLPKHYKSERGAWRWLFLGRESSRFGTIGVVGGIRYACCVDFAQGWQVIKMQFIPTTVLYFTGDPINSSVSPRH